MEKTKEIILATLDALALSLPKNFCWPKDLRKAYEKAVLLLKA